MTEHRISLRLVRLCLPPSKPGFLCAAVTATGYHPVPCLGANGVEWIFGRLTIYSLR